MKIEDLGLGALILATVLVFVVLVGVAVIGPEDTLTMITTAGENSETLAEKGQEAFDTGMSYIAEPVLKAVIGPFVSDVDYSQVGEDILCPNPANARFTCEFN